MADIPYAGWYAYIRKFLSAEKPVLELFSGPGHLAGLARADGFTAFALDSHFPFMKNKGGFHLVADARAIPFQNASLGTLIAPNCALNYLNNQTELTAHFRECRRALDETGFYIFDVCPEERAIALNSTTQTALSGKIRFAHRYQSASHILETQVKISEARETTELHRQHIFTGDAVAEAASAAGFTVAERTANYELPAAGSLTPVETWVLTPLVSPSTRGDIHS